MRLCQSVMQRRREQDQLAGSSLDSQKGGDKTHRDPGDGALSTFRGKVRVCGSTKSRAPLGSRWRPRRMWTSALVKSPGLRSAIVTRDTDFTALRSPGR